MRRIPEADPAVSQCETAAGNKPTHWLAWLVVMPSPFTAGAPVATAQNSQRFCGTIANCSARASKNSDRPA
jgi:hypothetical protein